MSYFFGPISGAFLAGVSYNMLQHTSEQMTAFAKQEGYDDKMMNTSQSEIGRSATNQSISEMNISQSVAATPNSKIT